MPPALCARFASGNARFAKKIDQAFGEDSSERGFAAFPGHLDALGMMPEAIQIQAHLIVGGANHLANFFFKTRLAIGA